MGLVQYVFLNQGVVSILQNFRKPGEIPNLVSGPNPSRNFPVLSGCEDYLANVLAFFHMGLRFTGLREREALVHMGANPAIRETLQQYFHPTRDHVGLVPHVAEVHPEDGFVGVHQRERMEERRAERHRQQAQRS
jgi:hypothetical protein